MITGLVSPLGSARNSDTLMSAPAASYPAPMLALSVTPRMTCRLCVLVHLRLTWHFDSAFGFEIITDLLQLRTGQLYASFGYLDSKSWQTLVCSFAPHTSLLPPNQPYAPQYATNLNHTESRSLK